MTSNTDKFTQPKKIFLMIDWFAPAFKAGGPIVAAVNFVNNMKDENEIFVFTGNRDLGESNVLSGIEQDKWMDWANNVKVFYASEHNQSMGAIQAQINNINPDFVYLHSMFSKSFTIVPLLLHRNKRIAAKVVLAPRGMLRSSALEVKKMKKKVFLTFFKAFKLFKNVRFHATDATEKSDIEKHFGAQNEIVCVPDFPGLQSAFEPITDKVSGELKIILVGRIHPIKNIDFLLRSLQGIKSKITVTLVGPVEDVEYWNACKTIAASLWSNIFVDLKSGIPHKELEQLVKQHHLFVLPTKGENFGHAIYESLSYGRPVLISDQTPWTGLEKDNAGWVLPLQEERFTKVINDCVNMNNEEMNKWAKGAWDYCKNYLENSTSKSLYGKLFSR